MFTDLSPSIQHHVVNTLGWTSLRPLQKESIRPILDGDDALLLAPTAGGKTEAGIFPLLTQMVKESWQGLSVLYVCPLKALLNNLEPRINSYAQWVGRRAEVRHGDTSQSARKHQALTPPNILLTTPESIESALISTKVDHTQMFAGVQAVVVDEVHSFAGDDRGWHLLSVLERISDVIDRPIQRIGLSATVGNPAGLLKWLQGSNHNAGKPATIVSPEVPTGAPNLGSPSSSIRPALASFQQTDLELDYVGNLKNAATVIAKLHHGEKRLVFTDSRRSVESLANEVRDRGVDSFTSHSSISLDERRRAEEAFATRRNCVIISTSTLELGVDVGDLDRVIQVGAPPTVASMLQRLGRTGRRPGTRSNTLFLAPDSDSFLQAAGLLLLHSEGYVEPVTPPPLPRHVLAQQLLGLILQKGRVGKNLWHEPFSTLRLTNPGDDEVIASWQLQSGHLDSDSGMYFIGPETEKRYGKINYRDLITVFTAAPEFQVFHGRTEVGTLDPMTLTTKVEGPRVIALAGRAWLVNYTDFKRRKVYVEPSRTPGDSLWGGRKQPQSFELADAIRRVLCGATPPVSLTQRASNHLSALRQEYTNFVDTSANTLAVYGNRPNLWTWAGARANAVLSAAISSVDPSLLGENIVFDNNRIGLRGDASPGWIHQVFNEARIQFGDSLERVVPEVEEKALRELKFHEMLPPDLARHTLAIRYADHVAAQKVVTRPISSSTPI